MTISAPSVGIVLLSFNRFAVTANCIRTLIAINYPNYSIIVVDNNSSDNSGDKIKAVYPDIVLLKNKVNLGFCGGNNVGIRYCLAEKFDYILLLNDDVVVEPEFLTLLVQKGLSVPEKMHVITGKIYCNHDRAIVWYAGGDLSLLHGIGKHRGHFKKDRPSYCVTCKVRYVSGCLMLVKSDVFETVGLFKESIFAYLDDTEFCIRLHKAGISIYYESAAKVYHDIQAGIGLRNYTSLYFYYSSRNRVLITSNWAYKTYLFLYSWIIAVGKITLLIFMPSVDKKSSKIRAIIRGVQDATLLYFGVKGKGGIIE